MAALAGCEQFVSPTHLVFQPDTQHWLFANGRDDYQHVVVNRRANKFRGHIQNWDTIAISLQLPIREALLTKQLCPGDFEPRKIVRMIDDAHHVGLRIADRNARTSLDHEATSSG